MDEKEQFGKHQAARRAFLGCLGSAVAGGAAAVATGAVLPKETRAAATRTRLRFRRSRAMTGASTIGRSASMPRNASAACAASRRARRKTRSPADAHHFRTWVERYVYLEGEDKRAHRQPGRPREHRSLRFRRKISIRQPL